MKELTRDQKLALKTIFNERLSFDPTERRLYAHDVGEMPKIMASISGESVPAAIVQPVDEGEVSRLVAWAAFNSVPLTPRGKATSGYWGAVPANSGVIVDFRRMDKILDIDGEGLLATVMPGIRWELLEKRLGEKGLALRLYPSSFPAATVGGWVGQGGFGYGSFEYGSFGENIHSVKAVLADGSVREFSGEDLDLIYEAEGITGLITSVTIKLMKAAPLTVFGLSFESAKGIEKALLILSASNAPVWSASFINPSMAKMKNRVPAGHHTKKTTIPTSYILTLAARGGGDAEQVEGVLGNIAKETGAVRLDSSHAMEEWENRFRILMIKRVGPSLIPSEVVVPVRNLAEFFERVEKNVAPPVVNEGLIVRKGRNGAPEAVLLGFIPGDTRKLSFTLAYGLSLSVIKIAEELGGRPYSTGAFFASKAKEVLGAEKTAKLKAFKAESDPRNILNPGKVLDSGLLGKAIEAAKPFEALVRQVGNIQPGVAEAPPEEKARRGIPADVAFYALACSQCGYCVDTCEQFSGRGFESQSPRGKWYWLRLFMDGKVDWNQKMVDSFIACTTCEVCDTRCPEGLPVEPSWMKLRGLIINEEKKMTFPPFEMMAAALRGQGNIWAGYRDERTVWFPEDLKEKHGPGKKAEWIYFAGCTASYVEHDIGIATVRLLDKANVDFAIIGNEENCCATPMLVAGRWDVFEETMRKNIELVRKSGARGVITSCPACGLMWAKVYREWCEKLGIPFDFEARHYSEVIGGDLTIPDNGQPKRIVAFHDSCHLGRAQGVYEPPREMIKSVPGVELREMEHNRETGLCCGSVLTLIKEPPVAAELGKDRLMEAVAVGASEVVAVCPCCEFQLRVAQEAKQIPVKVTDLAHFVAEALGVELPDPHPEVRAQWKVFEAFVALMSPEGFARLMTTMWPEVIEAMPLGMGKMMGGMAKVPGALDAMRPMFPVLFPVLLPRMMPSLLPTIQDRIGEMIPMPDYMSEQMGDLLPKVMDRLMPHMLADLVPLVTDPMIDYLRGGEGGYREPARL